MTTESRARHPSGSFRTHVSLRDVADFDRRHSTPFGQRWWAVSVVVIVYISLNVALITVLLPVAGIRGESATRFFSGFAIVTAAYTGLLTALIWRSVARRVRVDRLATAAGLVYSARVPLFRFAGTVLQRPGNQVATDAVFDSSPFGDVGLVAATFAPGSGLTVRRAAVLQMRLERPTPHIVLLNRRSRVLRRTGSRYLGIQRLGLEGDFDRTFSLFCPTGYERDALYIFTPDLMALMLDVASDCEIELIDGWLVAYLGRPWRLWRPREFAAMLTLADALIGKARRQTRRYQDERALPGLVAASGRRLRARPSAGSVLSLLGPFALGISGVVSLFTG